jgi:transcription elongation factor GreA
MAEPQYLTPEGLLRLKTELAELKGARRLELSARLRHAIQQGDLSENADYIQAKEEQGFLEGRILELEAIMANFVVIDEQKRHHDIVDIGSHITIQEDNDPPETYYLVGSKEANPADGKISHESPIGRALLGRKLGEEVDVETPVGHLILKIIKIE